MTKASAKVTRERAVAFVVDMDMPVKDVAKHYGVTTTTLYRWLEAAGHRAPRPKPKKGEPCVRGHDPNHRAERVRKGGKVTTHCAECHREDSARG